MGGRRGVRKRDCMTVTSTIAYQSPQSLTTVRRIKEGSNKKRKVVVKGSDKQPEVSLLGLKME